MNYDVAEYEVSTDKITDSLCIALLADLHDKGSPDIISILKERSPSLICIAGDLVNGYVRHRHYRHASYGDTLGFLDECAAIAPTYLSYGNHECAAPAAQLKDIEKTDITILDNRYIELTDSIYLGGLSAAAYSYQNPEYIWLSKFQKSDGYKILLSHRPEYFMLQEPKLAYRSIDLVLSGHADGGQIRVGEQGLYAPGQGFFPKYTAGIHTGSYGSMVVSRGLSNTTWIPRINNRPEIVYVYIKNSLSPFYGLGAYLIYTLTTQLSL